MYDPAAGRFTAKDSWQGDYNRPMSYNAWLYVYANPVNLTDPSGFDAWDGTQIHIMIENHYITHYGVGRDIETNYFIPGASKNKIGNWGFADIADLDLHQIYEIKPIEYDLLGEQELYWYLAHLPGFWGPGTNYPYNDTYIGPWPGNPNKEVHAAMHILGVIAYWGEDKRPDIRLIPVPFIVPEQRVSKQQSFRPGLQPGFAPAYSGCSIDPQTGAVIIGGTAGTVTVATLLWYLGKLFSPLCGPAAPACAIAF
jgi:hypothetical protein